MAETGWHRHGPTNVHPDVFYGQACGAAGELWPDPTPVLVLPLDGLEETIAREVDAHFIMWHKLPEGGPVGEWRCNCGAKFGFSSSAIAHVSHHVARALAGDGAR